MTETRMVERPRGQRARRVGVVTSDKMDKTVVVRVNRIVKHAMYKRYVRRSNTLMAHDETNQCKVGDTVEIIEARPLSARKRWRVTRVIRQGVAASVGDVGPQGSAS